MIELVKIVEPNPLTVLLSEIVGFWLVLQQSPLSIIAEPPSDVIVTPERADIPVILDTGAIVTVGAVLTASFLQSDRRKNNIPKINTCRITELIFMVEFINGEINHANSGKKQSFVSHNY